MARKYSRDNRGRFASSGTGATARGGRLRTATGNKRATQTSRMAAAPRAGTVGKGGKARGAAKPAASKANDRAVRAAKNYQKAAAAMSKGAMNKRTDVSLATSSRALDIYRGKPITGKRAGFTSSGKLSKNGSSKPIINRTRNQAAAAQLDRKRQTIENVKAIRGKQSYIAPEGINRKAVKINQRNLLTGGVDKVTAKVQTKVVGERNSPLSQFGRKTEARTERASTRLDALIQARRNTPKPRKASERAALAKIQKSISTVTRSFDSYRNARSGRRAKKP